MPPMRLLVLTAPGQVDLLEVPRPEPAPGHVLIRTHYCGICGTDLMDFRGENVWGRSKYPKYPGHELSGIVEAVGEGVDHLNVGDKVDAAVISIDTKNRRITVSIKSLEIAEEKQAVAQYGSSDSGALLGDIFKAAMKKKDEAQQ